MTDFTSEGGLVYSALLSLIDEIEEENAMEGYTNNYLILERKLRELGVEIVRRLPNSVIVPLSTVRDIDDDWKPADVVLKEMMK